MTKLANSFGHVYFRVHVRVHKSFLLKIPHGRGIYSVHIALKYIIAGGGGGGGGRGGFVRMHAHMISPV